VTRIVVDDVWLRRFHSGRTNSPTLVCFPHAGGSASYFRPLSEALADQVNVLAVQYPGRQDRIRETCLSTIDELADAVYPAVEALVAGPIALFGHSMGAILAFEVATRLKQRRAINPLALFASGRRAPSAWRSPSNVHLLDDRGLVRELGRLSGTDTRLLEEESVLRMILPPLRGDYRAIECYVHQPGTLLDCPIVALVGDADDSVDRAEAQAWEGHTEGEFTLHSFSGGHFYLVQHQAAVVDLIAKQLATHGLSLAP
jgi:pyochelin biosynthetic protein PchC